jgi:glycosyltransferase involved in cell wall biosynthesis
VQECWRGVVRRRDSGASFFQHAFPVDGARHWVDCFAECGVPSASQKVEHEVVPIKRNAVVCIDLTPWLKHPNSGIGLSAWRSFQALHSLGYPVEAVGRGNISGALPQSVPGGIRRVNLVEEWLGRRGEVYHSFTLSVPPVIRGKRIITLHDFWTLKANAYQDSKFQQTQAKKIARSLRRSDFIVVPSAHVEKQLIAWDAKLAARCAVVPWAPILRQAAEQSAVADPAVETYLAQGRRFVLVVACIEARKNHSVVLEAMENLPGVDLVLVGRPGFGGDRVLSAVRSFSARGGSVVQFTDISERSLCQLYENATVLVQPSLDEGFGMPVLEAMAFGKPVLLSKIPALQEIAGQSALYFDPSDAGTLRRHLEKVLSDGVYRQQLGNGLRERSHQFTWSGTAQKLVAIYRRLLESF